MGIEQLCLERTTVVPTGDNLLGVREVYFPLHGGVQ